MMLWADKPRRYSKKGKRWCHLICPADPTYLKTFGRLHGLKRFDKSPVPHYDLTEEELEELQKTCSITTVDRRRMAELVREMKAR